MSTARRSVFGIVVVAGVLLAAVTVAAMTAGGPSFWRAFAHASASAPPVGTLRVDGGDGAPLPVTTPAAQGIEAEALATAAATAQSVGASALLVARRGHLVFDRSLRVHGEVVRSALLSRLVLGAGVAALGEGKSPAGTEAAGSLLAWSAAAQGAGSDRNPWSSRSRARFGAALVPVLPGNAAPADFLRQLSTALWQPLAAMDAHYETDAAGHPRLHCCLWLRPRDALALAAALQGAGQIAGQRLLSAEAAGRVLVALDDGVPPRGAEAFGARQARVLRDDEGTRLYFFPAQELVILLVQADETRLTDETELAHQVLRGIVDRASPPRAPAAGELVPQHY